MSNILDSEFLHRLEKLAIVNKRLRKGLYAGKRRSKNQGSSIEFADYRTYTPGDDFRQIDWNAFARHEKLFLKTYLDEQEIHISLYIDCSKSMDFGEPTKFDTSIKIAAALGYLSLFNFDRVSVYGFDQQIVSTLPKVEGKSKAISLFHFLQTLEPNQEGDINRALSSGKATFGKPGISIIISDFLFEEGYENGISFIQSANQEVVLVQVLTTEEREPYFEGDLKLIDSETFLNKEVTMNPLLLDEYKKALTSYNDKLAAFAFNRGISYVSVHSEMDIEEIVFHVFKRLGLIK